MNEELENVATEEKSELEKIRASLNYERSERKRLAKELSALKEDDSKEIKDEEARIRAKLKNGKSDLSDDVVDDLMESIGKDQAKANVRNAKQSIERELLELKRDETYMDVDEYSDEMRSLMKKGLSAEQAYWAVAGATKYSNSTAKAQKEEEKEQKKKETKERTEQGYVEMKPVGEEKKEQYSSKERAIADRLGISVEEAHARSKQSFGIEEILAMQNKFKKGDNNS